MIRFRIFFQTNSYVCNMKWKYSFIVLLSALIACNNNTESKDSKEVNETLETLVRAGMAAPSSRDRRPWEFIIVTDRDILDTMGNGLPLARMLKETKQAIIVCGDTAKSNNA